MKIHIDESVKPVIYQPGQSHVADYAARDPVDGATVDKRDDTSETEHYVTFVARNPVYIATADERDDTRDTEHHVAFIVRNVIPKAMPLNEVESATANAGLSNMADYASNCR